MAERRMFAKTIILSDAFLDMPATARCLYFTLAMVADDDGFVNSPRAIMRQAGATNDDMLLLVSKKFVIAFDDGVVVIKHWRIHNYIRTDRYVSTKYKEDKELLGLDENKAYTMDTNGIPTVYQMDTNGIPSDNQRYTEVRLGKDRLGKVSNNRRFTPPTPTEVSSYCEQKGYAVDAERFCTYYEQQGWKLSNGNKMVDWQAAVRNWASRDRAKNKTTATERDYQEDFHSKVNDPVRDMLEAMKNEQ